jgi:NAD+ diphosphatase
VSSDPLSFNPLTFLPVSAEPAQHRWLNVRGSKVLVNDRAEFDGGTHFLGMQGNVAWWAEDVSDDVPDDGTFADLRSLWGKVSEIEWGVAGRAVQVVEWARTHRFCGRCGTPTVHNDIDRSMKCPACGDDHADHP